MIMKEKSTAKVCIINTAIINFSASLYYTFTQVAMVRILVLRVWVLDKELEL